MKKIIVIEIGDQLIAPQPKSDQTDGADGNFSSHTLFLYCLRFEKRIFWKYSLKIIKTQKFAEMVMFVNTLRFN